MSWACQKIPFESKAAARKWLRWEQRQGRMSANMRVYACLDCHGKFHLTHNPKTGSKKGGTRRRHR